MSRGERLAAWGVAVALLGLVYTGSATWSGDRLPAGRGLVRTCDGSDAVCGAWRSSSGRWISDCCAGACDAVRTARLNRHAVGARHRRSEASYRARGPVCTKSRWAEPGPRFRRTSAAPTPALPRNQRVPDNVGRCLVSAGFGRALLAGGWPSSCGHRGPGARCCATERSAARPAAAYCVGCHNDRNPRRRAVAESARPRRSRLRRGDLQRSS